MNTNDIIKTLRQERDGIDKAIVALSALESPGETSTHATVTFGRAAPAKRATSGRGKRNIAARRGGAAPRKPAAAVRHISAEGRKRMAEAARKMWANRRKPTAGARHMNSSARERIAEAKRQWWAERRKAATAA